MYWSQTAFSRIHHVCTSFFSVDGKNRCREDSEQLEDRAFLITWQPPTTPFHFNTPTRGQLL